MKTWGLLATVVLLLMAKATLADTITSEQATATKLPYAAIVHGHDTWQTSVSDHGRDFDISHGRLLRPCEDGNCKPSVFSDNGGLEAGLKPEPIAPIGDDRTHDVVPEPSTLVFVFSGLLGLVGVTKRKLLA